MSPFVHNHPRPRRLAQALLLALSAPVLATAQEAPSDPHRQSTRELDRVVVTASPLHQTAAELSRPVEVLAGERLDEAKSTTLGHTLERLPGIQSTSFGPGVGRPIIRGLDGARVQVVSDGMGSGDVSALSADHAVSIDPFLANRIEVLKGPATLLYGSGAIGGAVNVIDGRTPDALPASPLSGRAELRAGSVDHERTGMFRLDGATATEGSGWVFHADGLLRETRDSKIPGHAESATRMAAEGQQPDPAKRGVLPNSAVRTASGSLGASWVGERAHFGIATHLFNTRYGVPGHEHAAHDHGHGHGHAHDHEDAHGDVRIGLDQRRHEVHGGLNDLGIFKTVRFKYARTHYTHTEYEGARVGTVFNNKTDEGRIELVHRDIAGWQGAFGLQGGHRDFDATGDEAFVAPTNGRDIGVFWLGQRAFGPVRLELGARHDRGRIESTPLALLPERQARRDFHTNAFSAALRWDFNDALNFKLGLDRAQRAPTAEELYSNGHHVAIGAIEIGNDKLKPETAHRLELGAEWKHEHVRLGVSAFVAEYRDYIHATAPMSVRRPGQTLTDGGVPVRLWTQHDARFSGFEIESVFTLFDGAPGRFDLRLFGDSVRGRLKGGADEEVRVRVLHGDHTHNHRAIVLAGGDLPRIAPARVGGELRWEAAAWRASLGAIRSLRQDRVAAGETTTPGYTLVNAHLAWHGDTASGNGWELFLDGRNLLNEEARPHTSFLKDLAPLPGRGVVAGVRFYF
ncbi:TonB-dependent receptor [Lysobacter pythonis]|uniref:TonB-dependent receptor n=1 Tax=Solilutibacter pythonis TaxID=2483112 RepID=A0A3M2I093_9GAMM|nr:TonB-dependent receptor [Lysobacter pythonis]RMH93563.1 TonB-dependent receptor [Lysobacter pythonis]